MKYIWLVIGLLVLLGGGYFAYRYHQRINIAHQVLLNRNTELKGKIRTLEIQLSDRFAQEEITKKDTLKGQIPPVKVKSKQGGEKHTAELENQLRELEKNIKGQELVIKRTKELLRVEIVGQILFEAGTAEIKKDGRQTLGRIADILKTHSDKMIRVEGHTDNVKIQEKLSARYATNWELSAARALSVVHVLQAKGVEPKSLTALARGPYHPVADNSTVDGRSRNRRIVIILTPVLGPVVKTPGAGPQ